VIFVEKPVAALVWLLHLHT